jgi:hypothetical protein
VWSEPVLRPCLIWLNCTDHWCHLHSSGFMDPWLRCASETLPLGAMKIEIWIRNSPSWTDFRLSATHMLTSIAQLPPSSESVRPIGTHINLWHSARELQSFVKFWLRLRKKPNGSYIPNKNEIGEMKTAKAEGDQERHGAVRIRPDQCRQCMYAERGGGEMPCRRLPPLWPPVSDPLSRLTCIPSSGMVYLHSLSCTGQRIKVWSWR